MATSKTGERDHQALYDLEMATQGFTEAAGRQGRTLSPDASLRLGIYWAMLNSGLGFTHEQAKAAASRIVNT